MAEGLAVKQREWCDKELLDRDGTGQAEKEDGVVASCVVCGGELKKMGYHPQYRDCCSWSCCRDYYS